jgi:hypothetical protein
LSRSLPVTESPYPPKTPGKELPTKDALLYV